MMRRKVSCLLLVLLLVGFTAACSTSNDSATVENEKVEISFLTHWAAPQVEQLNEVIARYKEVEPDVEIEVRAVPFGNLLTTLTTQSTGSDAPTITSIYDLWLPQLVMDNIVVPAPEDYKNDINENYPENIVSAITVENQVYGYPNEVNLYALN